MLSKMFEKRAIDRSANQRRDNSTLANAGKTEK